MSHKSPMHQRLTSESERPINSGGAVPIHRRETELKDRLAEVIGDESQASFGRRCGIGESLLRKYLAGTQPGADKLQALAEAGGVNIEWLVTGRGPKKGNLPSPGAPNAYDLERLSRAIEAVQEGLQAVRRTLPPPKYAQLVMAAYELLAAPTTTSAQVIQFIRAAA